MSQKFACTDCGTTFSSLDWVKPKLAFLNHVCPSKSESLGVDTEALQKEVASDDRPRHRY